jgi:UDP-glucose 4-epimerase
MNILITGGAGYLGTELVGELARHSEVKRIVVYDNLSRHNFNLFLGKRFEGHHKVSFIKGELLDSRGLKKAVRNIDVVYHLAARVTTPFAHTEGHLYEQINHWGTAELSYVLEESPVKKIIYTSSVGIYGPTEQPVNESTPPAPKTFYAISKLRGEAHIQRLQPLKEAYIFRLGNVYGYSRSMRFDAVINKFVFEACFSKRITIHGNGDQSRPFIHVRDAVRALAGVIYTNLPSGTYNLVDQNLRVMDVVEVLKDLLPDLEFILINQHMPQTNLLVVRNDHVNALLGVSNTHSLKEQIVEFMQHFSF